MPERPIRLISNIAGLARAAAQSTRLQIIVVASPLALLRQCARADLVIIDDDWRLLALACLLRPLCRFRLVSVDLVVRAPSRFRARLGCTIKKLVLSQVDQFILYARDLARYTRHYGIGHDRAVYVPFKVNDWEERESWPDADSEGEFVLCAGRTLRDIATFVEAMRKVDCPGVLLQQQQQHLQHGTPAWTGPLPPNLRLVVDPTDDPRSFRDFISKARLVVIPRFRHDMTPTGVSTYLSAMALGKCVILSRGPGAEDVLVDEAKLVEPENCNELASAIAHLWSDIGARRAIAERGKRHAQACAGEQRLAADVLRASLQCLALDSEGAGTEIVTTSPDVNAQNRSL